MSSSRCSRNLAVALLCLLFLCPGSRWLQLLHLQNRSKVNKQHNSQFISPKMDRLNRNFANMANQGSSSQVAESDSPQISPRQFPTNFSQYLHQIIYRISILLVLQATTSHTRPPTSNLSRCSQPWKLDATYSRGLSRWSR